MKYHHFLIFLLIFLAWANITYLERINGPVFRYLASDEDVYDEVLTQEGEVRPAYKKLLPVYKALGESRKEQIRAQSILDFQGDNALLPLPRVLEEKEYSFLKKGVQQRGKAIRSFLQDHYSGKKLYQRDGVIPKEIIERIIYRAHEDKWEEYIRPKNLSFWYGPDIIRGPPGDFYVVEDNPGFIGGMGDLLKARESLFKNIPEYQDQIYSPDPQNFYNKMAKRYLKRAESYGGKTVMVQYFKGQAADNEDSRVRKIFADLGIETVSLNTDNPDDKRFKKKLVVDEEGVWFVHGEKKEKVGYIISNMEIKDLDPGHPANFKRRLIDEAELSLEQKDLPETERERLRELLTPDMETGRIDYEKLEYFIREESIYYDDLDAKKGFPGLIDAHLQGKVGLNYTPGFEFIGDKEFYIYVEDLIRYYLKEEPILRNMETGSFREGEKALSKVFENLSDYVIKGVDGRGGDAVWVGPKIDPETIPELQERIKRNPNNFIYQKYTSLSVMDNHIVDLRLISDVGQEGVLVADVPWGRAVPIGGDGKVNISASGSETAVLVNKYVRTNLCVRALSKFNP